MTMSEIKRITLHFNLSGRLKVVTLNICEMFSSFCFVLFPVQQGCINLIKSDKFVMLQKCIFQILLNFLFIKEFNFFIISTVFTTIFSNTNVFNIDNNKKGFLTKSAY